jgi:hypothetical protein
LGRHEHILARRERSFPAEHLGSWEGVARLVARDVEPAEPRKVCGESFEAFAVKTRSTRRITEPGKPAPLLMRLMTHKTTLDKASSKRARFREPLEALAEREPTPNTMREAQEDRGDLQRDNPVRVWRGEAPGPRGMKAARPCLPGGSHAS